MHHFPYVVALSLHKHAYTMPTIFIFSLSYLKESCSNTAPLLKRLQCLFLPHKDTLLQNCDHLKWEITIATITTTIKTIWCSVAKPCPTLCGPMESNPPGSSVHGILQARILEWVAISFSRGSSWPRDQTHVSCIGRWILYYWATREAHSNFTNCA